YRDALAAYAMALKYNPSSVSSANMTSQLEAQLGIDGKKLANEYEKSQRRPTQSGEKQQRQARPGTRKERNPSSVESNGRPNQNPNQNPNQRRRPSRTSK